MENQKMLSAHRGSAATGLSPLELLQTPACHPLPYLWLKVLGENGGDFSSGSWNLSIKYTLFLP